MTGGPTPASGSTDGSAEIRICERCWASIASHERFVTLAHLAGAGLDGALVWRNAYVHTAAAAPGSAPAALPGTDPAATGRRSCCTRPRP